MEERGREGQRGAETSRHENTEAKRQRASQTAAGSSRQHAGSSSQQQPAAASRSIWFDIARVKLLGGSFLHGLEKAMALANG